MNLLDGKKVATEILHDLKKHVDAYITKFNKQPKLITILVGDDPASKLYIKKKIDACKEIGILSQNIHLPNSIKQQDLIKTITQLNKDPSVNGILLQLPLPQHISTNNVLEKIAPQKDVDGLSPLSLGRLCLDNSLLNVCTPQGILKLLKYYNLADLSGKNVTIVGSSIIVGKPLAILFMNLGATVTVCNILTKNLQQHVKNADILVSAIGKKNIIQSSWFKPQVIAIDVGINRDENGSVSGDLDFETTKNIASYITPVPNGVGPMTIATLMENTIRAAKLQCENINTN
jgi:methylenetetrahydrofolate dehydrogenase (NADP+)/methenyltetrahydrofolate cyclohydrolase